MINKKLIRNSGQSQTLLTTEEKLDEVAEKSPQQQL
jgi:hypothetical protein